MAIDITRNGDTHEKKVTNHMVLDVFPGMYNPPATAGNYLIGYLPEDAHITGAYVFTSVISDAGAITIGTTEGAAQILSGGDTTTPEATGTFAGVSSTGTGVPVYISTAAPLSIGEFQVVVTYVEYRKNTGELTKIS